MPKVKKSRVYNRKKARNEALQIVTQYAYSMNMIILDMKNVRPENMQEAVVLLCDAREYLPLSDEHAIIMSRHEYLNIEFVLKNMPLCPECGCGMYPVRSDCQA